jgi:3-dehydroquinate synthase
MSELAIGRGILDEAGPRMRDVGLRGRTFVISNECVFPLYGERLCDGLRSSGYEVAVFQLPDGEPTKSLSSVQLLYDWLAEHRAERSDPIVALGGGVLGDITGFTAATFLRGMPLVQVPTTVLAQIDSSIGGKVGVNHIRGKNLIGAFYPARLIVADVETLRSLPKRLLADGWAEAVKYGMILDAPLLDLLEGCALGLCDPTSEMFRSEQLIEIVRRCAEHKIRVVAEDEREANVRMILNYGHTIGQGIEAALGYEGLLHGEAVSIGMSGAAAISVEAGFLNSAAAVRQDEVLHRFGLPVALPPEFPRPTTESVLDRMAQDKKSRDARIRWVVLDRIGHARMEASIPPDLVYRTVDRLLGGTSP